MGEGSNTLEGRGVLQGRRSKHKGGKGKRQEVFAVAEPRRKEEADEVSQKPGQSKVNSAGRKYSLSSDFSEESKFGSY